jgi:hypothetical protein
MPWLQVNWHQIQYSKNILEVFILKWKNQEAVLKYSNVELKAGKITIKYNEDLSTTVGAVTTVTRVSKNHCFRFHRKFSEFTKHYSNSGLAYNALPNIGNSVDGDDKLYLKGGEGSLAVISLLKLPELESRKVVGWLMRPILFFILMLRLCREI